MSENVLLWGGFNLFVLVLLALDLGVFHRRDSVVTIKQSLFWTAVWICLALTFNLGVYFWQGPDVALEFLTGYLIEKSLSVDNIFVFVMIFSYFQIPAMYQHRVLFWGILGALIMRAILIVAGAALLTRFHFLIYVFGGFLVITGIRMFFHQETELHPDKNPVLRLFRRMMPISSQLHGHDFFVKEGGRHVATPLFVTLLFIEMSDLLFATDSIPAIFAVTTDPFIVYTSNVFAILGLRSLYFALSGIMGMFHYLRYGLAIILVLVGVKMLIADLYKVPIGYALAMVAVVLAATVVLSIYRPPRPVARLGSEDPPEAPVQDPDGEPEAQEDPKVSRS